MPSQTARSERLCPCFIDTFWTRCWRACGCLIDTLWQRFSGRDVGMFVHVLASVARSASGFTTQLGRQFFHTPQSMTHRLSKLSQQHTPSSTYTHTHVCSNHHTHTLLHTPSFIAHLLSHTTFTYNSLTVRSYTVSFASFPCPLHLLF